VLTGTPGVPVPDGVSIAVTAFAVIFPPGCKHPPIRINRMTMMRSMIATRAILKYGCFHTGTRMGVLPFGAAAYPPP
jgi:hypothetical protein